MYDNFFHMSRIKRSNVAFLCYEYFILGFVRSFAKGYSRCLYTYTIFLAMKAIARSLNAEIHVVKVKRRSDNMSLVADLLSKGHLDEARLRMEDPVMGHYSSTLAAWIHIQQEAWG